ncbi:U-box domain-containing protein 19-like protein [Cinnamomum micranthum f. kanehirae]|uniref:RING-type E3 ubiquitin transferase n=1 Tax=Cinnamomum micranthum f. kanehirae TaxID=337451 RepID=A0A443NXQ9_9MAGN|nr:U-box domain-containing protein 19-like protein [Cinnamomum micranthum f. kanehirae]
MPNRRILTFPAVHPCKCVSPTTLLDALIALARTISGHRLSAFSAHRRQARETIREVRIILIFLEEIRNCGSDLPESAMLCFAELYVALQKICYLLEDCTREGARLWILMQLEQVTNGFRILIRMVATALDVLPLASMDLPLEVREMVELVTKQARKVEVSTDHSDDQAVKDVRAILHAFENRIVPNSIDLRRALDHLAIRSWKECNEEIKFLEEEIQFENSKEKEGDITLLSSLMGFMSYCRAAIFDAFDSPSSSNERSDCIYEGGVIDGLNLEDFRCPISLELMIDPVTVSTGQTYDRASIQKWFKAGNLNCPKTGEKLKNTDLTPNIAVHKLIQQFCYDKGVGATQTSNRSGRDLGRSLLAGSPVAAESMRILAVFLVEKLSTGTAEERNKAAYEIRLLSKSSTLNRASIVEAGAILWLLFMLSSSDPSTQENAIAALLNLSKYWKGKTVIFECGGLGSIVDVLRNGLKKEARQSAAGTLFYLSSVAEYREEIGKLPLAIPALVELVRNGATRGKKNAVVALFGLMLFAGNHQIALVAGIVPSLVDLLTSERGDLVDDSLGVLAALAENPEGTHAVVMASAIPLIVRILHSSTSRVGKEYCVSVLLSLCINGGTEVVSVLQKLPSLMGSLYLVLTEGPSRAHKKANSLLHILHNLRSPGASSMLPQAVRQELLVSCPVS